MFIDILPYLPFFRPSHWRDFIQRLRLLSANSKVLKDSKHVSPEALLRWASDTHKVLSLGRKTSSLQEFHSVVASGSLVSSAGQCHGVTLSALWLPIDLILEDTMDESQVAATSAVETLTGIRNYLSLKL